jgi:glucarate dehydratase
VGISETHGGAAVLSDLEAAKPLVLGASPYDLARLEQQMASGKQAQPGVVAQSLWEGKLGSPARTFGAFEVACLDIIGQATGQPLCNLLGGRFRESVPFSAYLFYKHEGGDGSEYVTREALTPEALVAQAQGMCAHYGFQSLKLKGGVLPPEDEVRTIFALREAFGAGTPLRIDPNAAWSEETARTQGRKMLGTLEYYEDPVRGKEAMGRLAQELAIPLATNMCCVSFADMPETARLGAIQILLSDHHIWGGLLNSVKAAKICETWGWGLSMHSNSHLGISLLAMTHLAAAIPNLTYACDTHYPWQSEEVIVGGKLTFMDGSLPVPTTPGLGATVDESALAALAENYARAGLSHRDDVAEMQKIQPGWKPRIW